VRIILAGAEFGMTGAGLLLFRYGAHLVKRGHTVSVMPRPNDVGPLEAAYAAAGVSRTPERTEIGPGTILICNTLMSAQLVIQCAAHAPVMWWLHEGEVGLKILAEAPGMAAAFGRAGAIVLPTPVLRDRIYRSYLIGVPEDRLAIVPPGVDPPSQPRPTRLPGPVRVVAIGSIYPRKRPIDLLRALAMLPDLAMELHFVGRDHGVEPDFATLAAADPRRVRLHGELANEQALQVLDQADVFALPSGSECMPVSTIEAGIRGIPAVLSDLPGHEGVWRHGQNCLMHPVGDVPLLAHMVRILATDAATRRRLGAGALQTARRFRTDAMMARLDLALTGLA
jgi:glycosyltransferase involved in cell wall biosynthesis